MALSEFGQRELARLNRDLEKLAHATMMGQNGVDSQVLINMGKYRQLVAERNRWLARSNKSEVQEASMMEDMPEEEDDAPPAPAPRRRLTSQRAKPWGGS